MLVAVLVLSVLFMGNPDRRQETDTAVAFSRGLGGDSTATVDEYSAAQIAADIAKGADLIVAENVQNLADSQKTKIDFAVTEGSYLAKTQQVLTDDRTSRDVTTYTVKEGETIPEIAKKFNITSDTIRWENDITGDAIAAGTKLRILPVSGIRYTVQEGDDADNIADTFGLSSSALLVAFNDAELSGFKPGDKIIVPNGQQPEVRQTYFSSNYGFAFGSNALYGGNGYSYGYCTWWAANRRIQTGQPMPRNFGHAFSWKAGAAIAGLSIDQSPQAGDIAWYGFIGGLGHVGFVEKVNPDGSIWISDMNYHGRTAMDTDAPATGGWNVVSYHLVKPSEFGVYHFIH